MPRSSLACPVWLASSRAWQVHARAHGARQVCFHDLNEFKILRRAALVPRRVRVRVRGGVELQRKQVSRCHEVSFHGRQGIHVRAWANASLYYCNLGARAAHARYAGIRTRGRVPQSTRNTAACMAAREYLHVFAAAQRQTGKRNTQCHTTMPSPVF